MKPYIWTIAVDGKILLLCDVDDILVHKTGVIPKPPVFIDYGNGSEILRRRNLIEQQLALKIRTQFSEARLVDPVDSLLDCKIDDLDVAGDVSAHRSNKIACSRPRLIKRVPPFIVDEGHAKQVEDHSQNQNVQDRVASKQVLTPGNRGHEGISWRGASGGTSTTCVHHMPQYGPIEIGQRRFWKAILSTKRGYFQEKVDPAGLGSAHLASNRTAEHWWELQCWRYARPQGLGHRPSIARFFVAPGV
ncbi:hypothetical protein [Microvirga tunisiensis]|uniref:hypothetical protein n=1 Tax=Microvirga tunisiensis TaxID=2108360 RepID=UPI0013875F46